MAEHTSPAELKQPTRNGTSPRRFYLVSRKSSQASASSPAAGSIGERGNNIVNCHRRGCSSGSQESYDSLISDTHPSANKASRSKGTATPQASEDRQLSFPESVPPKSIGAAATSRINQSVVDTPSQIPRASGSKGSSSQLSFRRKPLPHTSADSKMADQEDRKAAPTSLDPGKPSNQPPGSRENSYVKIDDVSPRNTDDGESGGDRPSSKTNGSTVNGHREFDNSQTHGDDDHKDQDDDDSYPDLDDMGIEEIHRPPPRSPNGGIRWAPWNVPFKRRGQTLVVLIHSLSIVATVSLFFAFCANPFAWPLLLIYLLHVLSSKAATDGSLKYRSERFRKSYIWHFFADYFPARLHKTHELPATRKYIFGYHPHGIISHGAWAAFATDALGFSEKFPGITNSLLTLDSNFRIPFYREYILSMGVRSVSKESIVNILSKSGLDGQGMGRGVTVVVGGARESLEAQPRMIRLILRERKGFIKLAVRCGADLVPVLAFGENDLYDQLQPREHPFMHRIQMFVLKVWKFTLPFLHGRGIFNYDVGLMPYRRPLNIVVGAPIKVRQSSSVDPEEINRLHGLYVAELEKLWDRYKDEFAPDRKEEMQILP
ncbi:diacylglycerol acyltransferase-domain-containing protein [Xylaria sp. FL0064]|nr:diacylglycerol acyltransferase-domain-containing protein [Xylaria sp. FL0064]